MKKVLSLLSFVLLSISVTAQSVLITPGAQSVNGDSTSQDQLNVFGNGVLVGPRVKFTDIDPASNVLNMSCASEIQNNSLGGVLKDPNGDADYTAGILYDCRFVIYTYNPLFHAYQIDFESLDTEADGDTVYVLDFSTAEVLGAYSGNDLPTSLIVSQNSIRIRFKTDNDANAGAGFVLRWKAILRTAETTAIKNYRGEGLVYDVESNALWAGKHGLSAFENRGDYSTALGYYTAASGYSSTALGRSSTASGHYSTALGRSTTASGTSSTALGYYAAATGNYSTALGTRASANGYLGAMVLGDYVNGSGDSLSADAANRLLARFENGYTFYTDNNLSNATKYGIIAHNRANSWSSISDSTKKENFIPSNDDDVLNSVAQMRIGTWNYKGDDTSKNRHWGVMAQDFYHHFGKDAYGTIGNDTTIATADFDGVSFAAIKALEERTRELQNDLASEKRFSASLELTSRKQEETIEKLQEQLQKQLQRNTAYESELLSVRAESMSVRAESRTVQSESKALKEDFKELKEMLLKSVAVEEH